MYANGLMFTSLLRQQAICVNTPDTQGWHRLNYRLNDACHDTITSKCADACTSQGMEQPCGGTVLRCLTEKLDEITNEDCKKEVFYFIKMEVRDFRNDVILAEACRADVDSFCANVEPGAPRVFAWALVLLCIASSLRSSALFTPAQALLLAWPALDSPAAFVVHQLHVQPGGHNMASSPCSPQQLKAVYSGPGSSVVCSARAITLS